MMGALFAKIKERADADAEYDLDCGLESRGREVLGSSGKSIARRNLIWSMSPSISASRSG